MAKSNESEQPQDGEQPSIVPVSDENGVDVETADGAFTHRVQPGEDWQQIADAHGVDVEALHALNADAPYFSERSVTVGAVVRVA